MSIVSGACDEFFYQICYLWLKTGMRKKITFFDGIEAAFKPLDAGTEYILPCPNATPTWDFTKWRTTSWV